MQPNAQKSLAIQKTYALSAQQMYDAAESVKTNQIKRLPSGNFQVRSKSRPNQFHQINPCYESCTCEAGKKEKMCYHLAAWKIMCEFDMVEMIAFTQDAKKNEAPVILVTDPIARRELAQKQQRAARPKTEWAEMIDDMQL